MTSTVSLDPKNYFVIVGGGKNGGGNIEGINSIDLSFPNDDCQIEVAIDGGVTFVENPAGKVFEVTLEVAKEQDGNKILQIFSNGKLLAPFTIMKASTNTPVIFVSKSRVMFKGWGNDNSGSDKASSWKIIGATSKILHT
ncbi:MAG TPA: hypothetical protein PLD55_04250 [bacterium]|nr:hypothetical protein [bacterium]